MKKVLIVLGCLVFVISCNKKNNKIEEVIKPKVANDSIPIVISKDVNLPDLIFTVQVGAYRKQNPKLSNLKNVKVMEESNLYKYRLGTFSTYIEARDFRNQSLNSYPDAFVQALLKDAPISIKEALNYK